MTDLPGTAQPQPQDVLAVRELAALAAQRIKDLGAKAFDTQLVAWGNGHELHEPMPEAGGTTYQQRLDGLGQQQARIKDALSPHLRDLVDEMLA